MMIEIQELLDYAFTMPTTVFSVLLIVVGLYWLVSLLGIFNLEMLEAADGVLEGAEALTDGADALADGADALVEGAEGAAGHGGPFAMAGFGDVPKSISGSLVIFFGWLFSLTGSIYFPQYTAVATQGLMLGAVALGAVSLGMAVAVTAVAIQPMRRLLLAGYGTKRLDLVGRVCIVKTMRVDEEFGQAELDDGSSIIQVRNPQGYDFQGGSQALIYEYDPAHEVFYIMPAEGTRS